MRHSKQWQSIPGKLGAAYYSKYDIEAGGLDGQQEFDQIKFFRRFLLFARDTIRWRRPLDPDIHWSAISGHMSTFVVNGERYGKIFWAEGFNAGMPEVLKAIPHAHQVNLGDIPRFNAFAVYGPERAHPVEEYFDDLSLHLMYEIYHKDFQLLKYDFENPANFKPIGEIDLDEVHAKLGEK